jgi:hypothetical protein
MSMEKRAAMQDFITEVRDQLLDKHAGQDVTVALREVMAEELKDMVKQAFVDEPQPEIRCDYVGTRSVKFVVKLPNWEE